MSWYKADKSSELRGTLLIDISWQSGPTCRPKNICSINNPLALPGTNTVFKWMHWVAKPLEIMVKLNMFSCFICQESHHHVFSFPSFCSTFPKIHFLNTSESAIRREKKREKFIRSTYFQASSQKLIELGSYGNDINHMKKYILDLPKIKPRGSTAC